MEKVLIKLRKFIFLVDLVVTDIKKDKLPLLLAGHFLPLE